MKKLKESLLQESVLGSPNKLMDILYKPKNLSELNLLILDNSIHLGSIDTSLITDISELFRDSKRKDFRGIEMWDMSRVTDTSNMFRNCGEFNQDISNWDVSRVKDMTAMFAGCKKFDQDLGGWDVSEVRYMTGMFNGCKRFNQDISQWDVKKVNDMRQMFKDTPLEKNPPKWLK